MAEAAGLALGAVALVSLFQTAVELLEYFEAARSLASDRELTATKLSLLEARLRQWGDDLHVEHPGQEDGGLRSRWKDEGGLVTKSLKGISEILGDATQLSEKYGLHKKRRLVWHSNIPLLCPILHRADTNISLSRKPSNISPSIRRQAVWAIKDKKRFEALISDLDFFITNLEKVSGRLLKLGKHIRAWVPTCRTHTNGGEEYSDSDGVSLYKHSTHSTMSNIHTLAEERHKRYGVPMGNSADASALSRETHHEFRDVRSEGEAFQPLGNIDSDSNNKHKYQNISAKDSAFQPCGDSKSAGLAALLKQHQEGFKNRPTA